MIAAIAGLARKDPSQADAIRDRSIILGFVFYGVGGLVFGAIWAEAAWGRFWGWDPKETWALVTTIVYAVYLHLRYVRKAPPAVSRIVAIVAWALAIFTFFGVNYLLAGLHSYA
jgi:ABC-type transport system involved in cytochrome c biogenesis permease subunit